ncbi:hypothetical protein [Chitinimonas sp. BJB300]|nr:hypothetical protein [Chitinimonas sp. BJB300]
MKRFIVATASCTAPIAGAEAHAVGSPSAVFPNQQPMQAQLPVSPIGPD